MRMDRFTSTLEDAAAFERNHAAYDDDRPSLADVADLDYPSRTSEHTDRAGRTDGRCADPEQPHTGTLDLVAALQRAVAAAATLADHPTPAGADTAAARVPAHDRELDLAGVERHYPGTVIDGDPWQYQRS